MADSGSTIRIRTLIPPGGFNNEVGHHLAALDLGLETIRKLATNAGDSAIPSLQAIGQLESAWIHQAIGAVPTPTPPAESSGVADWMSWLDSARTVTVMVLRSLGERDLERLIKIDEEDNVAPRTLKRVLAELLFHQGVLAGRIG